MKTDMRFTRRMAVGMMLMGGAIMIVLLLALGSRAGGSASASGGGPEMALSVTSGAASCSAGACNVRISSSFVLSVDVVTSPAAGYVLFQSFLDFGVFDPTASEDGNGPPNTCSDGIDNGDDDGFDREDDDCVTVDLVFKPTNDAADEIIWPELGSGADIRIDIGPGLLYHGGISGLQAPLPVSTFEGSIVQVLMTCPAAEVTSTITLLPEGDPIALFNGAIFVEPDLTQIVPKVGSLTINCLDLATPTPSATATSTPTPTPTPTPTATPDLTDTDGDGCSDLRENGSDETLGGLRDYLYPHDYYDVLGAGQTPVHDGVIDLPNDILGVIQHFSPQGQPPYEVRFDRGATIGANHWERDVPDGVIDLPNDILGVIQQFGHNCR